MDEEDTTSDKMSIDNSNKESNRSRSRKSTIARNTNKSIFKKNNRKSSNGDGNESFEDTSFDDSEIDDFINNEEYGDNVYDIEEEDDDDDETDDSDDDELYQISSEDEANITLQEEDLQEDELILPEDTLILLEISGEDPGFLLDKQYSLIGLDTPNPILKIGDIFYRGQYEEVFGTQLFFRNVSKKVTTSNNNINNFTQNTQPPGYSSQTLDSTQPLESSVNTNNDIDNNSKNENNDENDSIEFNTNKDTQQTQNSQQTQTQQHTNSRYKEVESLVYINKTSKKIIFHKIEVEKKKLISKPSHN
ncbi:hypothetical protein DICPUDRAFT_153092 [Dictyostelium purpureum]|uniref:Transcription factor TFIIIC triple barrel domain-containing protein n=1 Tax=Dictyostelium purpureum TaxID=5786 RepID=F0ZN14_DICPU|nr:uncharacterized protein DICPUDRAFT_153092 [Dictyostelium purpureum]EGC34662.1 hypothetical protein DICPUDRAFT_153092 [Dictyostelium purpureum]|eukprot:XP_003288799.1 hypothetical protein DICPUDRAFT_153092 [Dictyostelium purpureum]